MSNIFGDWREMHAVISVCRVSGSHRYESQRYLFADHRVIYHRHPQDSSHSQANLPSQLSMNDAQRNRMSKTMSYSLSFENKVTPEMPKDEVHFCMTDHTCYSQVNREISKRHATTLGQTSLLSFGLSEQNGSIFA